MESNSWTTVRLWKPKRALIQMFGLMVSESWKEDVAIPFVKDNLKDYLKRSIKDVSLLVLIEALRYMTRHTINQEQELAFIPDDHEDERDIIEAVVAVYDWFRAKHLHHKQIRSLEDMVLRDGFTRNQIQLQLYPDIIPTFMSWKNKEIRIIVDCPQLNHEDVVLYLKKTSEGDLNPLVDRVIGNDKEFMTRDAKESYQRLLKSVAIPVSDLLFVTQFGQRAKTMNDNLKITSLVVSRDESMRKIRTHYLIRFRAVRDMREVSFIDKKKE